MNMQQFGSAVSALLGYTGRPPHHIFRMIESCYLQEMSVEAAAKTITEVNVGSTG